MAIVRLIGFVLKDWGGRAANHPALLPERQPSI
jgi:hypothetical protein